jgi:hypothetical protein
MGKAWNRSNPANRSALNLSHGNPRITKKQHNQLNYQPNSNTFSTSLKNKKRKGRKNNNPSNNHDPNSMNKGGRSNPANRSALKRRHPVWDTCVPEKFRNEKGVILSKEEQEVYYRNKVDDFTLNIPIVENQESLPTKNILALVAGLTEEEPLSDNESISNVTVSNWTNNLNSIDDSDMEVIIIENSSETSSSRPRIPSPRLPKITLYELEDGEIAENDEGDVLNNMGSKRKKKKNTKAKVHPHPRPLPGDNVIELDSGSDTDSVICLDDNGEEDFANLSITTEHVQETVTTSIVKTTVKNDLSNQTVVKSQIVSKTTSTVTNSVPQASPTAKNMGVLRTVRHFRRSPNPLLPLTLNQHIDCLSFYIASQKKFQLRGPELIGFPSQLNFNPSKSFRVLSYNVLCQATMERTRYLYTYIDTYPAMFVWDYRWSLIQRELINFNADIYCLQEVEKDKVPLYYEPLMVGQKGLKSSYSFREGGNADGCAVFWNPVKFEKVGEIPVRLNHGVAGLDKPNVAQIIRLKHKKANKELIIVNTRKLFNISLWEFPDVM